MGKLAVVGLGLIGGSMALDLKKRLKYQVYGIDTVSYTHLTLPTILRV